MAGRAIDGVQKVAGTLTESIAERQQDAMDFLLLLLLERDDVVVDLDGAQRLEEEAGAAARAAVHDSRNGGAMFGANHEHVAPVAVRHDLLLEILRRVLAAEVRFQRSAQPRPLLPQPLPDRLQRRARIVDDFAGLVDLPADVGRLRARRRRSNRQSLAGSETRSARAGSWRSVLSTDARNEASALSCTGSSARPSTASESSDDLEIVGRLQADVVFGQELHGFRRGRERCADVLDARQRLEPGELRASGRRLRETADRFDNPIEFKGPQGAWMHGAMRGR